MLIQTTYKLKETNRDIVHSFNTKLSVWRLRYKPPKGKTADCFFICGYKSEAAAVADIPLLTKHLNTNKARISSFKPNFGILTPVFVDNDLTECDVITFPVTRLLVQVFDLPTPPTNAAILNIAPPGITSLYNYFGLCLIHYFRCSKKAQK